MQGMIANWFTFWMFNYSAAHSTLLLQFVLEFFYRNTFILFDPNIFIYQTS